MSMLLIPNISLLYNGQKENLVNYVRKSLVAIFNMFVFNSGGYNVNIYFIQNSSAIRNDVVCNKNS